MIKPVNSVMPNFRGIYVSKDFMQPVQTELADRIKDMLVSDKYADKKGRTLEQQAGDKADIFITQPAQPYSSTLDERQVNVLLVFSHQLDIWGNKSGPRNIFSVGSFTDENLDTFPDKFNKINKQNNPAKTEKCINYAAIVISAMALIGAMGKDVISKIISIL